MAKKKITTLDSLMFFTGVNADKNAQALEDRKYKDYNDEFIGTLNLNKDFDSLFSNTPTEIFVETTPKYSSIKDLTYIAVSYINNKSVIKPSTKMFINSDGVVNFEYNYEKQLESKIDNAKIISLTDIKLFLASLNNSMYNKQKYYSKTKEVHDILNQGVEYKWMPKGTTLSLYNEDEELDYTIEYDDDYVSYQTHKELVQETAWDENTNTYVGLTYAVYDEENGYTYFNKMINKYILDYSNSYYDIVKIKLDDLCEDFKQSKDKELLSYYLYNLNSNIPIMCYTLSFGRKPIDININYDGEFNNWFHNRISFDLIEDGTVKITPAQDYYFNFAINENERIGEDKFINKDIEEAFDIESNSNISLLSPYKLKKIDFSEVANKLNGEIDLVCNYDKKINYKDTVNTNWLNEKGSLLEELIIGKEGVECQITAINGIENFKNLKVLDLTGCVNLSSNPDLSGLKQIKDFNLTNSNISVFAPAKGSTINSVKLGDSIESIVLNNIVFKDEDSFQFNVTDKLSTLEINNVENLDSYKLVYKWINSLKEADKLDKEKSGTVNYLNITGLNWDNADITLLYDLPKIELNNISGTINATYNNSNIIYRQDYRKLIDTYGIDNINNPNSNLNINANVGENAFKVNVDIINEFMNSRQEINEFGENVWVNFVDTEKWASLVLNINDTVTGNSFINNIVNNPEKFELVEMNNFINNSTENVGLCYVMEDKIDLPKNTELPEELNVGDILLYGKSTLIIVSNDSKNINQNYTKIGKIKDVELFKEFLNYEFELKKYFTFTSMEDKI